jgi:hypothetical protein
VYWSYNGTSEINTTSYWTTPLLGPVGGTIQLDLWKLGAATVLLNLTNCSLVKTVGIGAGSRGLQACVQHPFALLIGKINITKNESIFYITCPNCNLTLCVDNDNNGSFAG